MNVFPHSRVCSLIKNAHFGKSFLPEWGDRSQFLASSKCEPTLDELDRSFNADFASHGEQQVEMVWHDYKFM
jgi:hypothetical protein